MELIERIDKALDSIRPHLAVDGGDVEVVEVTDDKGCVDKDTVKLTVNGTEVKLKNAYVTVSENTQIKPTIDVFLIKGKNPSCDTEELTFEQLKR